MEKSESTVERQIKLKHSLLISWLIYGYEYYQNIYIYHIATQVRVWAMNKIEIWVIILKRQMYCIHWAKVAQFNL